MEALNQWIETMQRLTKEALNPDLTPVEMFDLVQQIVAELPVSHQRSVAISISGPIRFAASRELAREHTLEAIAAATPAILAETSRRLFALRIEIRAIL